MVLIRGNALYDTDDYEEVQSAFEGYIYGSHRGLDEHCDKEYLEENYEYARWIIRKRQRSNYKI